MKYSIVIPTYNHCDDLLKPCVETLLKYSYIHDVELIISANGCKDNTKEYLNDLKEKFDYLGLSDNLKIVWHDQPLGYSRATNAGIEVATTDLIVLCNNDVVFFPQTKNTWLNLFERQFVLNANCGISCIIKSPSAPAGRDFAVFFLVMIHRKVFDKIGLLNTDYGVGGGEDTEFCIEAEKAGFEVCLAVDLKFSDADQIYVGDFPVYHKGEGTMHDKQLVPEWDRIFVENSIRLAKKYNLAYYKWAISNASERGVFFKGDEVFPREKFRYDFAAKNSLGNKVLEIGCSSGFGAQFFPDHVDYTGIDYDKEIIEAASTQNWSPNAKFLQADINNFELEQYDTIIAFETIEHIPNGLEVVERLKKHCKKLFISVPYNEQPGQFSPHHRLHNLTPEKFSEFTVHGLIDASGNLITNFQVELNIEYTLLMSWQSTAKNTDRLNFLEEQHSEVFKEIITDNVYNLTPELLQNKCVIDVGANIGIFSLYASMLGAKKVFAVEPVTQTFFQLCSNINATKIKNIVPLKYVVSDKPNQFVNISLKPNSGHNSLYNIQDNEFETVYSTTLNEILKKCEGDDIVLKLDCEGAEYDIIMNATEQDMKNISRVIMEIHSDLHPAYRGFEVLNAKMKLLGYVCEDVKQVYTWDINEKGEQVNWRMIPFRIEIWKK